MIITIATSAEGVTTLTVDGEPHEFRHEDAEVGRCQAFIAAAHALADGEDVPAES